MVKKENSILLGKEKKYITLKKAVKLDSNEIISQIKKSRLRGRGGAGFPTGRKMEMVMEIETDTRYVICNADEGEPGTFKDHFIIKHYPYLMIEGIILAGYAIGAKKGFIFLRGEYIEYKQDIVDELERFKDDNALGKNIFGSNFNFEIEIRVGSGAYICGAETALIESMEGQRGEPRNRPPFPVESGYLAAPTIVNNVETLACFPSIISGGAEKFAKLGTEKSTGTKLLSISGDCEKPGVYEVEYGISIKEVLELVGCKDTKAIQIGGASGRCYCKDEFNRKIAFEDAATGGSVIIFNKRRNMVDVAINFIEFFKEESCGQCSVCREGIPVLLEGLESIKEGICSVDYLRDLVSLAETLELTSKCALGQSAPYIFNDLVNKFKNDFKLSETKITKEEYNG